MEDQPSNSPHLRDTSRMLLDANADVAAKDWWGQTALHLGSDHGEKDVVTLLLSHMDRNPDLIAARDRNGKTALHLAKAGRRSGCKDVVALLEKWEREHGGNANEEDQY